MACANPKPEIFPDDAKAGGAFVVATGRSDFPNKVNNVLAFTGIFRGTFDVCARDINDEMKIAAARALAGLICDEGLSPEYIIPASFDPRVGEARSLCRGRGCTKKRHGPAVVYSGYPRQHSHRALRIPLFTNYPLQPRTSVGGDKYNGIE